jgi:hypothetical protein
VIAHAPSLQGRSGITGSHLRLQVINDGLDIKGSYASRAEARISKACTKDIHDAVNRYLSSCHACRGLQAARFGSLDSSERQRPGRSARHSAQRRFLMFGSHEKHKTSHVGLHIRPQWSSRLHIEARYLQQKPSKLELDTKQPYVHIFPASSWTFVLACSPQSSRAFSFAVLGSMLEQTSCSVKSKCVSLNHDSCSSPQLLSALERSHLPKPYLCL